MNTLGAEHVPFLFIIDFGFRHPEIHKLDSIPGDIKFSTPLVSNITEDQIYTNPFSLKKTPVSFEKYSRAFDSVQKNIKAGNTYLVNLTFPTEVETELTLEQLFLISRAKYRLFYKNRFTVFSPEIFVRIDKGMISAFPMKGTIDASVPDAVKTILDDQKEMAEHNTIVDLLRNDLSMVSDNVRVARHRYIDRIETNDKTLLQVSSEVTGVLPANFYETLGDTITRMLPAGSVTGAPKRETLRIINESEGYDRGWYTGVFGVFDGTRLDSAVMIRYIEKTERGLFFKSGGGITYLSDPHKEYQELIDKVYVPVG